MKRLYRGGWQILNGCAKYNRAREKILPEQLRRRRSASEFQLRRLTLTSLNPLNRFFHDK